MVDWPPEYAVVYHDNAPVEPEPVLRRGEYAANLAMAIASGWRRLPAATVLESGGFAWMLPVAGSVVAALGARILAVSVRMGAIAAFEYVCPPYNRIMTLEANKSFILLFVNYVELGLRSGKLCVVAIRLDAPTSAVVYGHGDSGDLGRLVVTFNVRRLVQQEDLKTCDVLFNKK
jgi:hypothetical protein